MRAASLLFTSPKTHDGTETNAGLGWRIGADGQGRRIYHHGGDAVGGRAFVLAYPTANVVLAIACNLTFAKIGDVEAAAIADLFMRQASGRDGRATKQPARSCRTSVDSHVRPAQALPGHRERRTHESWISMGRRGGARGGPLGHRSRDERGAATSAGATAQPVIEGHGGPPPPGQPAPATPQAPAPRPAGQGGQGGGRFPAQQRPKEDPELIQRGRGLFAGACGPCHGADARGGQLGGPNLLRSELALNDKAGELMFPVIKNGRPGTTMVADGVA